MKVTWSAPGTTSLGSAVAWWISSDARGLEIWLGDLRRALATLQRFPESGRPVALASVDGARSVLVEPYRIIYYRRDDADELVIAELRHLRRGSAPHLDLLK